MSTEGKTKSAGGQRKTQALTTRKERQSGTSGEGGNLT